MWTFLFLSVTFIIECGLTVYLSNQIVNTSLQVKLPLGSVQGTLRNTREKQLPYLSFEGIPYAVPPLEELRFKAPVPISKWNEIIDATYREVPICVQVTPSFYLNGREENEDCLYINIYTPLENLIAVDPKKTPHLPVMVWIHGGAFLTGLPRSSFYGPDYLLEQRVIVVHFGYRLNSFGFLSTEDSESPGNYGLKDQHLALKWVNKYIQYFGGDPNKITLFGESAGAVSVQYHLMYPKNKGLFRNAIMESGSALCIWGFQRNPRKIAFDMGIAAGIKTNSSRDLIKHFRGLSTRKIKLLTIATLVPNMVRITNGIPFVPSLEPDSEEAFITYKAHKQMEQGAFLKVPCIIGLNSKESHYGKPAADFANPLLERINIDHKLLVPPGMNVKEADIEKVEKEIKAFYLVNKSTTKSEQYLEYINDVYFVKPILESAKLLAAHVPTYLYNFTYEGYSLGKKALGYSENENIKGVSHTEEMWYIWARDDLKQANNTDKDIRSKMVKLWTNFAKYNNPTPKPDPELDNVKWLPLSSENNITNINIGRVLKIQENSHEKSLQFWDTLYKSYARSPFDTY